MPRRNSICGHEVAKYNQKSGAMKIYFGGAERGRVNEQV